MSTERTEVVGVFDSNLNAMFEYAESMQAAILRESKVLEHPIETGETIADHKVILPVEIDLQILVRRDDLRNTYELIARAFTAEDLLIVQTRASSFSNMTIMGMPHEEKTDRLDVLLVSLVLKQAYIIDTQFQVLPPSHVSSQRDASTINRGEVAPKQSVMTQGAGKLKEWWKN